MTDKPEISIYFGPLSWFEAQIANMEYENLLDIVYERDEGSRRHVHYIEGQQREKVEELPRKRDVIAFSRDYSSLYEHTLSNFSGLIRTINPESLHLHNPPEVVQVQLQRFNY